MASKKLTIGMATAKVDSALFFTIESLHLYQDMANCDVLVVDNIGNKDLENWMRAWRRGKYDLFIEIKGTSQPRNRVFEVADSEYVICVDPHVLLAPDAVAKTVKWLTENDTDDLFQGPLMYDSLSHYSTHFEPIWRADMWGIWSDTVDEGQLGNYREPFEIYMQGLGLFGAKKSTWLGFNNNFRGFGGEEGYIHEKYRKAGRKTICMPWLKWCHYFNFGRAISGELESRIRNYMIGFKELGLDVEPIYKHFGRKLVDACIVDR